MALRFETIGKLYDGSNGLSWDQVGNGQAILGTVNDFLLIASPAGNAAAYETAWKNPNFWTLTSVGMSFYGGSFGLYNDIKSINH